MRKDNPEYKFLYPHDIPELSFKAIEIPSQEIPDPGGSLFVPPDAVNVHLLRYGLYKDGTEHNGKSLDGANPLMPNTGTGNYRQRVKMFDNDRELAKPENAPTVPGYRYYGAPVREGWLYVYNETTEYWHEYKILAGGELQTVVWERFTEGYDEREPAAGTRKMSFLKVVSDHVIWLAYSEVQWTSEYTGRIAGSEENRKKRMQRIDCNEWLNILEGENLSSVNKVCAASWEYNGIRDISYDVYTRDYHLCKAMENSDHHLYIYLHDPMGAADDIAADLTSLYVEFDALVQSLGSSKSKEDIWREEMRNFDETHLEANN